LALLVILHGCTAWSDEPLGLYPPSAASLNGPTQYFIGMKVKF
jgi:hypothetical protein